MAGIYIHIPFCKQDCDYCNFYFTLNKSSEDQFTDAVCKEIEFTASYLKKNVIETVYFGGGTPSILKKENLNRIIQTIYQFHSIQKPEELTLEANPDDLTEENLLFFKSVGLDRLSIGIQSFFDSHLNYMNRSHNAQQAIDCIERAKKMGFEKLSIDLIYGIPGLSNDQWIKNLYTAFKLEIPHISCYALTVENGTRLKQKIKKGQSAPVQNEQAANQFQLLMNIMRDNGYEHYEISNFAKPKHRAIHNSNYWYYKPYLGLGPSAHSFNGIHRRENVRSLKQYIETLLLNALPTTIDYTNKTEQYNEYMLVRLRTSDGCSTIEIKSKFGVAFQQHTLDTLERLNQDFYLLKNNIISLTDKGKLLADRITLEFIK